MNCKRQFKGKSLDIAPSAFVCLDIETTGLSPAYDNIIEISAIKCENGEITATFSEIINIHRPLPPFISSLTGITDKMISSGRELTDVLSDFYAFTDGHILMGHNVNFDINFLYDNFLSQLGVLFSNDFVDTLRIAKRTLPFLPHHRLDDITAYYGLEQRNEHRALNDCLLTVNCFYRMTGGCKVLSL